MAVKIGRAMGAEVTVFSTSPKKEVDAKRLGAKHFVLTSKKSNFLPQLGRLDLIIDTVSVERDFLKLPPMSQNGRNSRFGGSRARSQSR